MKSAAAFLLTCLSSVLLLSACSAVDKLINKIAPVDVLPPVASPPSPTVGAQARLGATVAVQVGTRTIKIPLASDRQEPVWVDQASYSVFGTPGINPDALFNYYGRVSPGVSITAPNREFLFVSAAADASRTILDSYVVLRSSSNPASVSPIIADYEYITSATVARIVFAATLGARATVNHRFSLGVSSGLGTVTAQILGNGLRFGDNTVTISGAYGAKLHGPNPSTNPAMSLAADLLFIEAEYAALYLRFDNTIADPTVHWGSTYSGGGLTRQISLPRSGTVTYNIDHVIGAYTDGENLADNKLLYGNGNLMANFTGNRVSMNLTVYDHSGAKFMDVTNLGMTIRAKGNYRVNDTDYAYYHRNQFFCGGSSSSVRCTGSIDYADDANTRLPDVSSGAITGSNAHGSFYGPNGEEVAGGFVHRDNSRNSQVNLGFIGKKQPSP